MTDFVSKDTVYYAINQYNGTPNPVVAQIDESLVYPLISKGNDYTVGLVNARVDLSTIPLTRTNIPLQKYKVGLRDGNTEVFASIKQINAKDFNYVYSITQAGVISKYQYLSNGEISPSSGSFAITAFQSIGFFFVDDYENYYIAGSIFPDALTFELFQIYGNNGDLLYTDSSNTSIVGITIDRSQNIYIASNNTLVNSVAIFANQNYINAVSLTLTTTIENDFSGNPLGLIRTICADSEILIGTNSNTVNLYNATTYLPITTYNATSIKQLGSYSAMLGDADRFLLTEDIIPTDYVIGLTGANTAEDAIEPTKTFVSGGIWDQFSKMAVSGVAGMGYGSTNIGTGYVYQFTYDPLTNSTGTPHEFDASNTGLSGGVVNFGKGDTGQFVATDKAGSLYGLCPDNYSTPSSAKPWTICDTGFATISQGGIGSFDFHTGNGKILAIDNLYSGLYETDIPIYPKCVFIGDTDNTGVPFPTLKQYGVGWNSTGQPNSSNELVSTKTYDVASSPLVYTTNSFIQYTTKNYYLQTAVDVDFITHCRILITDILTGALISNTDLSGPTGPVSAGYIQGTPLSMSHYLDYFYISNGCCDGIHNSVFWLYNGELLVVQLVIPAQTPAQTPFIIDTILFNSNVYLAVSTGLYLYVYNITSSVSLLISAYQFNIGGVQALSSIKWCQPFNTGTPFLMCTSYLSGFGANSPTTLFRANFTSSALSAISSTVVFTTTSNYCTSIQGLQVNNNMGEVYTLQGGYQTTINVIEIWNLTSNTMTSNIILNGLSTANNLSFFWIPQLITGTYKFNLVETGSFQCVAMSKTSPDVIYLLNDQNLTMTGTVTNGILSPLTRYEAVSHAYDNISTVIPVNNQHECTAYMFSISSQNAHGSYKPPPAGAQITSVSRNNPTGEFTLSYNNTTFVSLLATADITNTPNFSSTGLTTPFAIWTKSGENIDAGPVDIFNIQVFIDAINLALVEAWNALPTKTSFVDAPYLTLNYATSLLTLNYDLTVSTLQSAEVLFNNALLQLCTFQSAKDTNSGYNSILMPNPSTSITQTDRTLYQFNLLDKIVFISNTIFVNGSFYGNNSTNNVITSINAMTSEAGSINNIGSILNYAPNFLRTYQVSSSMAIQRVQLSVNYVYLDGTQYQLMVNNSQKWDTLLVFIKRF